MKIQKKDVSKVFQPITLEITIESEDELKALRRFAGSNVTAAGYAAICGVLKTHAEQETVAVFLENIFHNL